MAETAFYCSHEMFMPSAVRNDVTPAERTRLFLDTTSGHTRLFIAVFGERVLPKIAEG